MRQVIVLYTDALLGGSTAVPTIHGEAQLPIPAGTQNGQVCLSGICSCVSSKQKAYNTTVGAHLIICRLDTPYYLPHCHMTI